MIMDLITSTLMTFICLILIIEHGKKWNQQVDMKLLIYCNYLIMFCLTYRSWTQPEIRLSNGSIA